MIGQIASTTNGRGIFVYDRGGDGDSMFRFYISHGLDFIVHPERQQRTAPRGNTENEARTA